MTGFSGHLINELYDIINKKLKENYTDFFIGKDSELLDTREEILKNYINNLLVENFANKTPEEVRKFRRREKDLKTKTKKRYYDLTKDELTKKNPNPRIISDELDGARKTIRYAGLDGFRRAYECENIDDLLKKRLRELDEWLENKESYITDFKYLSEIAKYTHTNVPNSFDIDFIVTIAEFGILKYDGDFNKITNDRAEIIVDKVFFVEKKSLMKMETEVVPETKQVIRYNDYQVDKDYIIRTILNPPKPGETSPVVLDAYYLDPKDSAIINFVLSQRAEDFLKDQTITVDMADIISKFYKSNSSKSYDDAERRLKNIAKLKFSGVVKRDDKPRDTIFVLDLFQDAIIDYDESGKRRIAQILVGTTLYKNYLDNKIIRTYKNLEAKFEGITSLLIPALQKERVYSGVKEKEHENIYPLSFFKIKFTKSKISYRMNKIEESLLELQKENYIIKNFRRLTDSFVISFIPLDEDEKKDLINTNTPYLSD